MTQKKLLLLGGTADGRQLAEQLYQPLLARGITLLYSIAGLVRTPVVPCRVVSGGFTQYGGLAAFIQQENIIAILDVTHPYAQTMSTTAVTVAKQLSIPCWRFHRQAWEPQAGDCWHQLSDWEQALPLLASKNAVLLTAGQLSQTWLDQLVSVSAQWRLSASSKGAKPPAHDQQPQQQPYEQQQQQLRTAVKPKVVLPDSMQWIKAIGPFAYDDELQLMRRYNIDALVSKNSGGSATEAKLHAARTLGIPVFMLQRPSLPEPDHVLLSQPECLAFIVEGRLF